MNGMNGKIETIFTLLSPLSHIGENIGPDSHLASQGILDAEGNPVDVFVYSGNALRGMWRDAGAEYMLKKLGKDSILQIPIEMHHLFFGGGSIGGDQSIDIDQARRIRAQIPHLSLLGGGTGNSIMPGKWRSVGQGYPVCKEFAHIIPDYVPGNRNIPCRQLTTVLYFTRKDDTKDDLLRKYLQTDNLAKIEGQQMTLLADPEEEKKKEKKEKPQQMRYSVEVLRIGTVLWQEMFFRDLNEIELGAIVAAISEWAEEPFLGGQKRAGLGKVKAEIALQLRGKEKEHFITVDDNCLLSEPARNAKARYDEFLEQYAGYLEKNQEALVKAIAAGK